MDIRIPQPGTAPLPLDPDSLMEVAVPDVSSSTGYTTRKIKPFDITNSGFLIYKVLMSQVGTENPTIVALKNSLGNIVWTRTGVGQYLGTLDGAFTAPKKPYIEGFSNGENGTSFIYRPIVSAGVITGYYTVFIESNDAIRIKLMDPSGAAREFSTLLSSTSIPLSIEVYP